MAITFVQDAAGSNGVSLTGTAAGNFLVVGFNSVAAVTAVSDGVNTWVQIPPGVITSPQGHANLWYAENIAGGNITVTGSGSTVFVTWLAEFSGAIPSSSLASSAHLDNQPSGPISGPSLTDAVGTGLLVAVPTGSTANPSGVAAPWVAGTTFAGICQGAYYIPGSPLTSQAVFSTTSVYCSAGAVFRGTVPPPATGNMFLVF